MKTEWDYTNLADAYLKRPDYAQDAIDNMVSIAKVQKGDEVCDVGAGVAHLTLMLAAKGLKVSAVEPNDAMRANGIRRTEQLKNVVWFEGVGESTNQPSDKFKLVTFGSSFNVTDRLQSLSEAQRILVPDGWFACMWNHRDLSDDIQSQIEGIIKYYVPEYSYGTRREDQTEVIRKSGRFDNIQAFSGKVVHHVKTADVIEGWRSHGTLYRQAKDKFEAVIKDIEKYLDSLNQEEIEVPYITRVWMARVMKEKAAEREGGGIENPHQYAYCCAYLRTNAGRRHVEMELGDFTKLAKDYINRPGYSLEVLRIIGYYAGMNRRDFRVADVGAGTGKLTENLSQLGLIGCAVEPNDAMREEGIKLFQANNSFQWSKGTAEQTGLPSGAFDWVIMGSSFHWAKTTEALAEFHRILKPGGYFTAIWNPRNIEGNAMHERIENMIESEIPGLKRVSSGSKRNIGDIEEKLLSTGLFSNLFFVEAPHSVVMSKERYLGVWRSVNDIQAQAGPERFERIMRNIEEIIRPYSEIEVPYKSRAWTVQAV